jgi:hypothetical protein
MRVLGVVLLIGRLLLAEAPVVTDTKVVNNWEQKRAGQTVLRKINGRWWSQDNREVSPPGKGGGFWTLDSKPGTCQFYHHRPLQLDRAESLRLWMSPQDVEATLGPPNRALGKVFWFYYASNGVKVSVRFMGEGVLGEANYEAIGQKSTPVASVAADLNGRNIYKLLQERASKRFDEQHASQAQARAQAQPIPQTVRSAGQRARPNDMVLSSGVQAPDPQPAAPRRAVPADALTAVSPGNTRKELLSRLGEPRSRYAITDDQGTRESYTYDLDTGEVVVIRLVDGKVTKVR